MTTLDDIIHNLYASCYDDQQLLVSSNPFVPTSSEYSSYPELAIILQSFHTEPLDRDAFHALITKLCHQKLLTLCGDYELTTDRKAAIRIYLIIHESNSRSNVQNKNNVQEEMLLSRRQLVTAFTSNTIVQEQILATQHLHSLIQPNKLNRFVNELLGDDGDGQCDIEEWIDFTDRLKRRKDGIEIDWNMNDLDDNSLNESIKSVPTAERPALIIPKLKTQQEQRASKLKTKLSQKKKKKTKKEQQPKKSPHKKAPSIKSKTKPTTAPVSIEDDLFQWIVDLKLSNASVSKSVTNWRRAFANGYLFAELLLYHYDAVYFLKPTHLRGPQIILSAFDPVVSAVSKMQDNWTTLLVLLKRIGIKLKLDAMLIQRIMKSREKAGEYF